MSEQQIPEDWKRAVDTLRDKLLEICLDCRTSISTAALTETLVVILVSGAPTLDEAKRVFEGLIERADDTIDSVWAARRAPAPWDDENQEKP
jgi:hypothetical protein